MNRYKICVYAISKNEEQFVDRWMDAVSEADEVIVTDTGSTDGTVEKLRARGATVYEEAISPWRFDTARNTALGHVPEDTDICVSNDLDEVFIPGWRALLEAAWSPDQTRARYLFTFSMNADGTPKKQYTMEKIHIRHGYGWIHPVHEILVYSGEEQEKPGWIPGLVLNHYPDLSKPRSQYLPLLELSVKENPFDDRAVFWLGREYAFRGDFDKAIETLKRHLTIPSAAWPEERSASMRFIAYAYGEKGDKNEELAWLYKSLAECPDVREPYHALARFGYLDMNWALCFAMAQKGLTIKESTGSYLVDPVSWGYALYDYAAISAYRLGMYETANDYAVQALKLDPENKRLQSNLQMIEVMINKNAKEEESS